MDEAVLQALCTSFTYYHTLEEQNTTIHGEGGFYPQRHISCTRSTYAHFAVKLDNHYAAAQLTITPFIIQSIPDQTFYKASYRYALCCSSAAPTAICNTVQKTYDTHYRPTRWDFSSKQCSTIDHGEQPTESIDCLAAVATLLRQYLESARRAEANIISAVPDSEIIHSPSPAKRKRARRRSLDHAAAAPKSQIKRPKQSHRRDEEDAQSEDEDEDTDADAESVDEDENAGAGSENEETGSVQDEQHADCDSGGRFKQRKSDADEVAARRVVDKIRSGLREMGQQTTAEYFEKWSPTSRETQRALCVRIEKSLWKQGNKLMKGGREMRWMHRYLCSCFALARMELVVDDAQGQTDMLTVDAPVVQRTQDRWRSAAYMTNMIVEGLRDSWGGKAQLVYHALAAKDYNLGECKRISKERQIAVVIKVVDILGNDKPGDEKQQTMFDPARIISESVNLKYDQVCKALGLQPVLSECPSPEPYIIKKSQELRFEVSNMSVQFILNTTPESQAKPNPPVSMGAAEPELASKASCYKQGPQASGTDVSTEMSSVEAASPTYRSNSPRRDLDSELKSPTCELVQPLAATPPTIEGTADVVHDSEHQRAKAGHRASSLTPESRTPNDLRVDRGDTVEPCYQSDGISFTDPHLDEPVETDLACHFYNEENVTDLVNFFHLEGNHIDHTIFNFSEPYSPENCRPASPLQS